jgi:hypothetical protein
LFFAPGPELRPPAHHVHTGKPMSSTKMQQTRTLLSRIYGVGILVFALSFGFITLLALFLAQLKLD